MIQYIVFYTTYINGTIRRVKDMITETEEVFNIVKNSYASGSVSDILIYIHDDDLGPYDVTEYFLANKI